MTFQLLTKNRVCKKEEPTHGYKEICEGWPSTRALVRPYVKMTQK